MARTSALLRQVRQLRRRVERQRERPGGAGAPTPVSAATATGGPAVANAGPRGGDGCARHPRPVASGPKAGDTVKFSRP